MKRTSSKLFIYSLSSLAVMASGLASAQQLVSAPTLEGGVTASLGALYLVPSSDAQDYVSTVQFDEDKFFIAEDIVEVNPGYDFGWMASLGYVFEGTANGVELSYRGISTDDSDSIHAGEDFFLHHPFIEEVIDGVFSAQSTLSYDLNAADLMINQFLDVGTHVQMRFSAGASYVNLEREQTSVYDDFFGDSATIENDSQYRGFGPRVAADGRYDFGQGFGILGGASLAFYVGDLDIHDKASVEFSDKLDRNTETINVYDNLHNHVVTNLRGNVGIDYVVFFDNEERSTLGVELGYLVDYYADATQQLHYQGAQFNEGSKGRQGGELYQNSNSNAITFSGPYLEVKGAF